MSKTFIIAEIGINHNGDLDIAKKLIDEAVKAGCGAVKFQKRTGYRLVCFCLGYNKSKIY